MLWHFFALECALHSHLFSLSFHHVGDPYLSDIAHCQKVSLSFMEQAREMKEEVVDIFEEIIARRRHVVIGEEDMTDAVIEIGVQDAIKALSLLEGQIDIVVANWSAAVLITCLFLHNIKEYNNDAMRYDHDGGVLIKTALTLNCAS